MVLREAQARPFGECWSLDFHRDGNDFSLNAPVILTSHRLTTVQP